MTISNTTNVKGLYTFGNELSFPEGSLEVADNVVIDEDGIVKPRRGFKDIGQELPVISQRVKQHLSYKKNLIRHYGTTLEWLNGEVFSQFSGVYEQLSSDTRIKFQEANSNLYFTTKKGVMKISAKSANDFLTTPNYITPAGVPKAIDIYGTPVYSESGYLPPQSKVAYKVLFGKKDFNNNLLLGAATSRFVVSNISKDIFTFERTFLTYKQDENFVAQRTVVTCSNVNNTYETNTVNPNSYILIDNAENENKYILWFDKGTGIAPVVSGYTNIRIDLQSLGSSDPVGPAIVSQVASFGGLNGINLTISGNILTFTNTTAGISLGVRPVGGDADNLGPVGAWAFTVAETGTVSRYIKKFFTVNTLDKKYCVYYGNSQTIDTVPEDPSLDSGYEFIGIQIANNSPKSYIATRTSAVLSTVIASSFSIEASTSGANPFVSLTSINGGNIPDSTQGNITTSVMEVSIVNQGAVTSGKNANVELTFTIPENIDNTFFYRIYRTAYISSLELEIPFDQLDPGEECFLVYEEGVTQPSGSKITIIDSTPESFRQTGEPLYENPESGDGTLSANNVPPVAVDITNYNGYTFYSNTSNNHSFSLDILSIDSLTADLSKIQISNQFLSKKYEFVGKKQITRITTSTKSDTKVHTPINEDSYIVLYSADNETKYIVYFDDGTGSAPEVSDAILVRVNISELLLTDYVAEVMAISLSQFPDFSIETQGNDVIITNIENGSSIETTTPNEDPVLDIGTGWVIDTEQLGEGEDLLNGKILLSAFPSVGIKIEKTARSIVDVINADSSSPINGFYVSGQNDIPGKIQFEAKDTSQGEFYISIESGNTTDFIPELPELIVGTITDVYQISTGVTGLEIVGHDFVEGEEVFFNLPNTIPVINGKYKVSVIDSNNIQIDAVFSMGDSTGSSYFFPFATSDNSAIPNRLMFSKRNQPEAVPRLNYIDIGTRDEPIKRILALRDNLFIMKTDGIFMLSGYDSRYFTVRQLDTERIGVPDSAQVLNNQIYMMSTNSILTINESSPSIISRMIENKIRDVVDFCPNFDSIGFGVAYDDDRSYTIWLPEDSTDEIATQAFRYNILTRSWTRWTKSATCGLVVGVTQRLYIGDGDRAVTMVERKKKDRTDQADRNFDVFLNIESFIDGRYRLSSVEDIEVGDVITQTQVVSVDLYNMLLDKLNIDTGLPSTDYDSLVCKTADNIASLLTSLNLKLIDDDSSGTVTMHVFDNTDWDQLVVSFNELMDELNDLNCVTTFKDYQKATRPVEYEYIVESVNVVQNEVTFNIETNIVQGTLVVYKQIKSEIIFNPTHFGNPSSWKQVSMGYVLFDQNNFYRMKLEYNTDLSASYEGSWFDGKGSGFWGSRDWGFTRNNNYWGGDGNDAPRRSIIPRNKQRCRYIKPRITHSTARDFFRINGIAFAVREYSNRAYKGL